MDAYITYDLSGRQDDVKRAMIGLGYMDNWNYNNKVFNLPNTCLWRKGIELADAYADINNVINNLNANRNIYLHQPIRLERCMVVAAHPWYGIPGDGR
jgi:hypothetical protein